MSRLYFYNFKNKTACCDSIELLDSLTEFEDKLVELSPRTTENLDSYVGLCGSIKKDSTDISNSSLDTARKQILDFIRILELGKDYDRLVGRIKYKNKNYYVRFYNPKESIGIDEELAVSLAILYKIIENHYLSRGLNEMVKKAQKFVINYICTSGYKDTVFEYFLTLIE